MWNPRSCTKFPTPMGTTIGWSAATRRKVRRSRWSKWACVTRTKSIEGKWWISKPGCLSRLITLSHFDQIGSIRILTSWVWIRNEAWPIQVMQISPSRIFGNWGAAGPPARLTKSEGIRTLVRKLRLCQSARGRSRTRVESRIGGTPSRDVWLTTFLRLLFAKRIGTAPEGYRCAPSK